MLPGIWRVFLFNAPCLAMFLIEIYFPDWGKSLLDCPTLTYGMQSECMTLPSILKLERSN